MCLWPPTDRPQPSNSTIRPIRGVRGPCTCATRAATALRSHLNQFEMKMPEYTAGDSLYKTSKHYSKNVTLEQSFDRVAPQFRPVLTPGQSGCFEDEDEPG